METRKEIAEIVDRLPEEALTELLRYLKELDSPKEKKIPLLKHLKRVMEEDNEVLQRLAK